MIQLIKKVVRIIPIIFTLGFIIFLSSCSRELATVSNISVSQGTYFGIVHITWTPVPDAQYYIIERMGADGQWIEAGSVSNSPFDDYGYGLPDNKLVPGEKYSYRIISGSDDEENSEPIYASEQGWIYIPKPIVISANRQENSSVVITWNDTNQYLLNQESNLQSFKYVIKRKYEDENDYRTIHTTDYIYTIQNPMSFSDSYVAQDKKVYYRIEAMYFYMYKNMDLGDMEGVFNYIDSNEIQADGNLQSNYAITDLGSFPNSGDGYGFLKLKNINSILYAAVIPKPTLGAPEIYKFDGSSWNNISSNYPQGLQQNFDEISFCGNDQTIWCGGISDSAYIYAYDGNWSENLAAENLGLTSIPEHLAIEFFDNNLHVLCYYDNKLELYSENGNVWNKEYTFETNSSIMNIEIKIFNGEPYVYYLITNSEYNSTLKIWHFTSSSWQKVFDKAYDNIMNVKIAVDNLGEVFFISSSQKPAEWQGNVYKVISTSSAQELVNSSNTWLIYPSDIDFDNSGNLVVIYAKFISQSEPFEEHLAVFEDEQWKEIADDYTNIVAPADIEYCNNLLYFVFGDGSDLMNGYPTVLKSKSLQK